MYLLLSHLMSAVTVWRVQPKACSCDSLKFLNYAYLLLLLTEHAVQSLSAAHDGTAVLTAEG